MLKPQASASRELNSLDGLWDFALDTNLGQEPWTKPLPTKLQCPVPASYNDVFVSREIHDHVGTVWYQRTVIVPRGWSEERYFIRVDAATHRGFVYVNETFVAEHVGGYTPFEADITDLVKAGEEFRLTIGVNNELSSQTIPPGEVTVVNGKKKQTYYHDFYNYAGLARSVWLYSVPVQHIQDITVVTDVEASTGIINYKITAPRASAAGGNIKISLVDEEGAVVAAGSGHEGSIRIVNVKRWQPGNAYLYQFRAQILNGSKVVDTYNLQIGVRTVRVDGMKFLINETPFYFTGFGKHEDTEIRGKGHDPAYMVHDFELMDWIGANSFRTSHYPYAEEVMDFADRHGIVVIDETAAVGLNLSIVSGLVGATIKKTWSPETFNDQTREANAQAIRELIARDKNHACVVLWSIANEPASNEEGAREFFEPLAKLTRELDPSRSICFVNFMRAKYDKCLISDLFDVLCLNRYYGWYVNLGDLDTAEVSLETELRAWQAKHGKPIIMTEYGADTQPGLHAIHDLPWSEEYQVRYMDMYHRVHDRVEALVGEQVWNFADFQTSVQIFRLNGNKKGVFSRDRKPKAVAHTLKQRWTVIREEGNSINRYTEER